MFHTTSYKQVPLFISKFKFALLFLSFTFFIADASGQSNSFKEKSDPEATKILKKLKEVYSKFDALQIDYSLEIENGEDKEVQQGSILQKGDKYRINNLNPKIIYVEVNHGLNFNMSKEESEKIIKLGYDCTEQHLKKF